MVVIVIPNWIAVVLALAACAASSYALWLAHRNRRILARAEEIIGQINTDREEQP